MMLRLASALIFVSACAGAGPPPAPTTHEATVLAISAKATSPLGFGTTSISIVYFARVEVDLLVSEVIPSNYVNGDYVYLLDPPPGRYAPVALGFRSDSGPSSSPGRGGGVSVLPSMNYSSSTIVYLAEPLIEKLSAQVRPGSAVFLGRLRVDTDASQSGSDRAQRHYHQVMAGGREWGAISAPTGPFFWLSEDYELDASPDAQRHFRTAAKAQLVGTIWEPSVSSVDAGPRSEPPR